MGNIEDQPGLFHGAPSSPSFLGPLGRQGHIVPASKEIEFIPGALTMAKEDKFSEHEPIV